MVPAPVMVPPVSPEPATTLVTVPPLLASAAQIHAVPFHLIDSLVAQAVVGSKVGGRQANGSRRDDWPARKSCSGKYGCHGPDRHTGGPQSRPPLSMTTGSVPGPVDVPYTPARYVCVLAVADADCRGIQRVPSLPIMMLLLPVVMPPPPATPSPMLFDPVVVEFNACGPSAVLLPVVLERGA